MHTLSTPIGGRNGIQNLSFDLCRSYRVTPLYSNLEFGKAKSRDLLPLQCAKCHKTFYLTKKAVLISGKPGRRETGEYCSRSCCNSDNETLVELECNQCGVKFNRELYRVRHGNQFCSSSCSARYNNTHKKHGTRVSKLEVWLQSKLTQGYQELEFHFNQKSAINSELDIYIPSMRLAFELNGIFHYEPIYGVEKLGSIQSNDQRKFQACLEQGIELCIIDVSQMVHFKEKRAIRFLEVIQRVITAKVGGTGFEPAINTLTS